MGPVTALAGQDGDTPAPRSPRPAGKLDETRCSVRAANRGDSPTATAAPAQRWVLVEQPGPWGRDALLQSRIDPLVAARLAQRARSEGVRVLLIRRPDARAGETGHRWAYVDGRPGRQGAWWSVRGSDAEIADAPWDGSVGERRDELSYLVCSHGGHDACCALRGRPVARGLLEAGADVWECSHLGGDRFAANVVVLPLGVYYGRVPGDGAELLAAHAKDQVALPWLRGRAGLPPAVQAAQHHARTELGLLGVDDLPARRATRVTPAGQPVERWEVALAGADGDVLVTVECRPTEQAFRLTCSATHEAHARVWEVVSTAVSSGGRTTTSTERRRL
ncbi:sucrase ferredoxin [Blastococcus sp. URHD0036]|uniref:sucrase ferredoxin n=1 Tax=Blastococcus sp. URHD0036 TaxID=1380356 RepID=UPI0009DFBEDB